MKRKIITHFRHFAIVNDMPVLYDGSRHVNIEHALVDAMQFVECDNSNDVLAFWRQYFEHAAFVRWRNVTDVTPFDGGFLVPYRKYFEGFFRLPEADIAIEVCRPKPTFRKLVAETDQAFEEPSPTWMISLFDYWAKRLTPRKSYRYENYATIISDDSHALSASASAIGFHTIFDDEGSLPATILPGFAIYRIVEEPGRLYVDGYVRLDVEPSGRSILVGPDIDLWGATHGEFEMVTLYCDRETDRLAEITLGKRFLKAPTENEIKVAPSINPTVVRPLGCDERLKPWHYGAGLPLHVYFGSAGQVTWFEPINYVYFDADILQTTGAFGSWNEVMGAKPTQTLRI